MNKNIRKHVFYIGIMLILFLGSLSAIFRDDFQGDLVSAICCSVISLIMVYAYMNHHKQLW